MSGVKGSPSCFVCGKGIKSESLKLLEEDDEGVGEGRRGRPDFGKEVKVFVVRILFGIPDNLVFGEEEDGALIKAIEKMGMCGGCGENVEQAKKIYQDLMESLRCFRGIQRELVKKVKLEEKKNRSREAEDVLGKWKQFICNFDYRSGHGPFLVEDLDHVMNRSMKLWQSGTSSRIGPEDWISVDVKEESADKHSSDEYEDFSLLLDQPIKEDRLEPRTENGEKETDADVRDGNGEEEHLEVSDSFQSQDGDEGDWRPEEGSPRSGGATDENLSISSNDEEYVANNTRGRRKTGKAKRSKKQVKTDQKAEMKSFNCSKCTEVFTFKDFLISHVAQQHPEATFSCHLCSKIFLTEQTLKLHLNYHNRAKPKSKGPPKGSRKRAPFKCKSCPQEFPRHVQLVSHVTQFHPEAAFSCSHCSKLFSNECGLKIHLYKLHNITSERKPRSKNVYKCPEIGCGKVYSDKKALAVHISKHKGEPGYKCPKCPESFWSWQQWKRHDDKVHTGQAFICEACGKNFACLHYLQVHRNIYHPTAERVKKPGISKPDGATNAICELCGKEFLTKSRLNVHIRTTHEKKYTHFCEVCGRGFFSQIHLNDHLYRFHKIGSEQNLFELKKSDFKYRCQVVGCRKKYYGDNAEQHFKKHMVQEHGGENAKGKRFKCEVCGKDFAQKCKFRYHQLIHENKDSRPFKCDTCGKGFPSRVHLRYHQLNTHKAERLFKRKKETKPRSFVKDDEGAK